MNGGQDGSNNYILVMRQEGSSETPVGKVARRRLRRGDVARLVTGAGGGFGDPRRRPKEKVLADVHDGYITREQALRDYGIDLD
jgi:N-methylhydantoinase B